MHFEIILGKQYPENYSILLSVGNKVSEHRTYYFPKFQPEWKRVPIWIEEFGPPPDFSWKLSKTALEILLIREPKKISYWSHWLDFFNFNYHTFLTAANPFFRGIGQYLVSDEFELSFSGVEKAKDLLYYG